MIRKQIAELHALFEAEPDALYVAAKELQAPYGLVHEWQGGVNCRRAVRCRRCRDAR